MLCVRLERGVFSKVSFFSDLPAKAKTNPLDRGTEWTICHEPGLGYLQRVALAQFIVHCNASWGEEAVIHCAWSREI